MASTVSIWQVLTGVLGILAVFVLFSWLLYRARRTHTRRVGGLSFWTLLGGRFPRLRRRR